MTEEERRHLIAEVKKQHEKPVDPDDPTLREYASRSLERTLHIKPYRKRDKDDTIKQEPV